MKKLVYILSVVIACVLASCGAKKSQAYYDMEPKVIASDYDGTYAIRSFGRARNAAEAYDHAHRQAVYNVIFKGVKSATANVKDLKPLLLEVNAEEKYEDYFNRFFAPNGDYTKFSNCKDRRWFSSRWRRTDAQSTAQVTVHVKRAELRQFLIDEGIIK